MGVFHLCPAEAQAFTVTGVGFKGPSEADFFYETVANAWASTRYAQTLDNEARLTRRLIKKQAVKMHGFRSRSAKMHVKYTVRAKNHGFEVERRWKVL